MSTLITYDMVDDLLLEDMEAILSGEMDDEPSQADYRNRSETAEHWATDDEFELEGEELRPILLRAASLQASYAGDDERALHLALRAVEAAEAIGDWLIPDVRIRLYEALRVVGDEAKATEVEAGLRKRLPLDLDSFAEMADIVAGLGDTELAGRWFTMGIRFAEKHDLTEEFEYELLLISRAELRESLGLQKDEFDLLADAYIAEMDDEM
ncbi:hypothetical protein [Salinibacterium sp. ZJ450]|uniref:hypothetical protein n=1 Tax=Salinibacterium sp. ZJ450 TaxID=2708338 RepID=UPI00141ED925|nr:hypothetical protein [Salinibacterium sp. ZJ450]